MLKRYRLYCSLTLRVEPAQTGNGTLTFYALMGHVVGVRYILHSWSTRGVSKAQALEMLAIAFVHAGPRGMETIAEAAKGIEFEENRNGRANSPTAGRRTSKRSDRASTIRQLT